MRCESDILCRIFLIVAIALTFSSAAEAASLGISNPDFNFRNMQRSGYAERSFLLSTDSENVLQVRIEASGEAAEWIRFSPDIQAFNISKGHPYQLALMLQIPPDAENGNYTGTLRLVAEREYEQLGNENIVKTAIIAAIRVEIGGPVIRNCTLVSSQVKDAEIGTPFEAKGEIRNNGNTRITPVITVEVKDDYTVLFSHEFSGEVKVGKAAEFSEIIPHNLSEGKYLAAVSAEGCNPVSVGEFSILEKGSMEGKGELAALEVAAKTALGELVPVSARFMNTGESVVSAKFVVDIYYNGRLEQTVETSEVYVPSGQSRELVAFFAPKNAGAYEAVGRVYYNSRFSGYMKGHLRVDSGESPVLYAAIGGIIIVLAIIIIKRRKRMGD